MAGERPLSLQRVNALVKPLIELSGETHYYAAVCARERIIRMQKQLSEKLKSTGAFIVVQSCDMIGDFVQCFARTVALRYVSSLVQKLL